MSDISETTVDPLPILFLRLLANNPEIEPLLELRECLGYATVAAVAGTYFFCNYKALAFKVFYLILCLDFLAVRFVNKFALFPVSIGSIEPFEEATESLLSFALL